MEFKDRVKAVRAKLFITQVQLANELGCSMLTIHRWEHGIKQPSFILGEKFKKFCLDHSIGFEDR